MGQQNSKSNLFLKITLGQTQSHQLFDFQNGGNEQEQFIVQSPSYVIDRGETVQILKEEDVLTGKGNVPDQAVYKILLDEYQQITLKDLNNGSNRVLWRIVKGNEAHPIKPGDVIKVGKIKLELKRIVERKQQEQQQQETVKDIADDQFQDDLQSLHSNRSNCDRCRICFRSYNNKTDPLVCLCKCAGSIKFIHFSCLKDWISNNFSKREDQHCKFYTYHQASCQLCKNVLPNEFRHQGRQYSFLDFGTFEPPYAEFEYTEVDSGRKKHYKYIISLQKDKEVLIGRNNSSQVVMKDISISRTHCSLEYKHGIVLLRDKKSKFGTLLKVSSPIEFTSESGLQLQFDSKVIELYSNKTFKTCCSEPDNYRLIYEADDRPMTFNSNRENPSERVVHYERPAIDIAVTNIFDDGQRVEDEGSRDREQMRRLRTQARRQPMSRTPQMQLDPVQYNEAGSRLISQGVDMEENPDESQRHNSARLTMIRETLARDQAIRY